MRRNLEEQNDKIIELLSNLNISSEQLEETLYEPLSGYPLQTVDDFKHLDADKNIKDRKKLVSCI